MEFVYGSNLSVLLRQNVPLANRNEKKDSSIDKLCLPEGAKAANTKLNLQ